MNIKKQVLRVILPIVILAAGIGIMRFFIATKPIARQHAPRKMELLVTTIKVMPGDHIVKMSATGVAEPARSADIASQVSGEILEVPPEIFPGSTVEKGQLLARIDPQDYTLLLQQKEAQLMKSEQSLAVERGEQVIARKEYELFDDGSGDNQTDLILRKPQLKIAESDVRLAKAALDDARLDLERTSIVAPFNAIVREKMKDVGAMVSPSSSVVSLIGTDEYWVRLSLPARDLKWLILPGSETGKGSSVNNT